MCCCFSLFCSMFMMCFTERQTSTYLIFLCQPINMNGNFSFLWNEKKKMWISLDETFWTYVRIKYQISFHPSGRFINLYIHIPCIHIEFIKMIKKMVNELDNKINNDNTKRLNSFVIAWKFADFSSFFFSFCFWITYQESERISELNWHYHHCGWLLVGNNAK